MTPKQRSRARVVQALYQWLVSGDDLAEIEKQFLNQKIKNINIYVKDQKSKSTVILLHV